MTCVKLKVLKTIYSKGVLSFTFFLTISVIHIFDFPQEKKRLNGMPFCTFREKGKIMTYFSLMFPPCLSKTWGRILKFHVSVSQAGKSRKLDAYCFVNQMNSIWNKVVKASNKKRRWVKFEEKKWANLRNPTTLSHSNFFIRSFK